MSVVLASAEEIVRINAARPGGRLLLIIPLLTSKQAEQRRRPRRRTWWGIARRIIALPTVIPRSTVVILLVPVLTRRIPGIAAVIVAALAIIAAALLVTIALGFHARHQIVLGIDLSAGGVDPHIFGERIRGLRGERVAGVVVDRDRGELAARLRGGRCQRGARRVELPHGLHHRLEDRKRDLAAGRAGPERAGLAVGGVGNDPDRAGRP